MMLKTYGTHAAQDVAIACNDLRRAVRELSDEQTEGEGFPDRVGLSLAANTLDQVADALDRNWWILRPLLDEREELRAARSGIPADPLDTGPFTTENRGGMTQCE